MPFAGYENFNACVEDQISKGKSEESAKRICGALQSRVEMEKMIRDQYQLTNELGDYLVKKELNFSRDDIEEKIRKISEYVLVEKASSKEINQLPDSAFAIILPGGKKDDEGKTVPRSLRKFPIHDAEHVRNALARLNQADLTMEQKKIVFRKIIAAAKKYKIEVSDDLKKRYT